MIVASGYDEHDRARWVAEPAKRPGRTDFERDRARVLHASALRRLAGKTQVVDPGESDFPRTRLTHSLECAQVGRELGQALGCDPDLVEAGCLAHDLGHPPFGHNGEAALDEVASDCGGFEGNAQSLRILTRLEAKSFTGAGRSAGLNLTRAVLDAATKYPWPRRETDAAVAPDGPYGVYPGDMDVFQWIRDGAPAWQPCLEAQIMDWADDVAYSVHDLEDGVHAGHVDLARLRETAARHEVCAVAATRYATADQEELQAAFERLSGLPYWPSGYDGDQRGLAALKDLTSQLIGRFCAAAEGATRNRYGMGALCRYGAALIVPRQQQLECAVLKGVTARYVMGRTGASGVRANQREVLSELAEALSRGAPDVLEPAFGSAFLDADDDRARLRVVVDQIASLTDASALGWHRRLLSR